MASAIYRGRKAMLRTNLKKEQTHAAMFETEVLTLKRKLKSWFIQEQ